MRISPALEQLGYMYSPKTNVPSMNPWDMRFSPEDMRQSGVYRPGWGLGLSRVYIYYIPKPHPACADRPLAKHGSKLTQSITQTITIHSTISIQSTQCTYS
jgi:hypothetical protein